MLLIWRNHAHSVAVAVSGRAVRTALGCLEGTTLTLIPSIVRTWAFLYFEADEIPLLVGIDTPHLEKEKWLSSQWALGL
jgi:hypothetical protein